MRGPESGPDFVAEADRHGGDLGLGTCQAVSGDAFGRATCRSGPCPRRSQTVMSLPVRPGQYKRGMKAPPQRALRR